MINLNSKSVLITGGSRGIGAACVKLFAEAGAVVHFTYKSNLEAASKLVQQIGKKKKIFFYKMDFSNEVNLEHRIIELVSKIRKIDILVNNAGIWEYASPLCPAVEEILIILPNLFFFINGITCLVIRNMLVRLACIVLFHSRKDILSASPYSQIPALLTRIPIFLILLTSSIILCSRLTSLLKSIL